MYKSLDEFVKNMTPNQRPRAIVIGSPPMFRGTSQSGRDTERQIMKHFPGVPLFIEKPIATGPESEMQESFEIAKQLKESGTIHSVGYVVVSADVDAVLTTASRRYMLRYLKAVQQMKQIIIDNNLTVMATIARYACAYEAIAKPDWWTKSKRYAIILLVHIPTFAIQAFLVRLSIVVIAHSIILTNVVFSVLIYSMLTALAPSSSKALTSAICPATSVVR